MTPKQRNTHSGATERVQSNALAGRVTTNQQEKSNDY